MSEKRARLFVVAWTAAIMGLAYFAGDTVGYDRGYNTGKKVAYERALSAAEYGYLGCIHGDCIGAKETAMFTKDMIERASHAD